ncbi:hypothetical protein Asppvi_003657 [Aspergillus pseudoviridinutans]|uniref:Enoyl reductase (ER) domain-containing protein n=1 Tax=Aspergillus pseudoviridinutans TaxID=1517512 RepID=A0A9P3ER12_9EURO|nr:uncharacterized protein Asppvi_003657 [Aspergillus pseudoviridinutans]GIJ84806.1 hypothetical protein Asppvi_003657 [Aspergillus pseudoviridinutans]
MSALINSRISLCRNNVHPRVLPSVPACPRRKAKTVVPAVEKTPSLQPNEVLIKVHAVSLNYRDVGMLHGKYPVSVKDQGIPASDCAGEVVAVGSAVEKVSVGDRVSPVFDMKYLKDTDPQNEVAQLGGNIDGVLQQYAVFDENVLVHTPQHLSWEEAACITCAGTTAWNSLTMPIDQGRKLTALMLDKKLQDIAALAPDGAIDVINYRSHPDWEKEVLRRTNGRGVDIVLETVGGTSIKKSISSLAKRGVISWVGWNWTGSRKLWATSS